MPKWGGWEPTGFGQRLKALRETAGLSQDDLAERASCNKFTVAKLEQGRQEPAWPLVLALAKALGVGVSEFVNSEPATQGETQIAPARQPRGRPPKQADQGNEAKAEPATEPEPEKPAPETKSRKRKKE